MSVSHCLACIRGFIQYIMNLHCYYISFIIFTTWPLLGLSILAEDDMGVQSPALDVTVNLCSGCSNHGSCDFNNLPSSGETGFHKIVCDCDRGYTGIYDIELHLQTINKAYIIKFGKYSCTCIIYFHFCSKKHFANFSRIKRWWILFSKFYRYLILKIILLLFNAGDNCEREVDACLEVPCSLNRHCTDLSPEEESILERGYNCSDCPPGYDTSDDSCSGWTILWMY